MSYLVSYPSSLVQVDNIFITAITVTPANPKITALDNVTLTCRKLTVAINEIAIKYLWYRVDDDLPQRAIGKRSRGRKPGKLTIPNVVPEDEGEYYCRAKQFGHCAESNKIMLTVDGEKQQNV